jgi:hypothetical protein
VAQSRGAALDNRDQMLAASYTAVLSSRVVNELRFQLAKRNQTLLGLDPTCSGICDGDDEGGPTVEIAGVANAGRSRLTPQLRDNTRFQVLDTLSYQAGRHLWKAGVDVNVVDHPNSSLPLHFGGRYIFASLPAIPGLLPAPITALQAVALGLPAAYVQGYGNPQAPYVTQDVSTFVQDQWRIRPTVTAQLGLRYQMQFWGDRAYTAPGVGAYQIPGDWNNLAPRLGIAWDPLKNGSLSLHGAYGMYYDNIISGAVGVADIVNGTSNGVRTLVQRFPLSIGAWNAPGRRLPESAVGSFPSLIISIDPNLKASYSHQFSAGVDRELRRDAVLSAGFVYVRGFNQLGPIDFNPLVPALGPNRRPEDVGGVPGTSASVLRYTSFGETWYRAITISLRKRFGRSEFLAGYTLADAEDNTSDFQTAFVPQSNGAGRDRSNPTGLPVGFDPASERGPSLQDQRHRFVFSSTFELPSRVQLSGIVKAGSGTPYNILAGTDLNGDGDGGNFPTDRARTTPSNPSSSLSRNAGRLRAEGTVDVRVSRRFSFYRNGTVEPIFEVFNLLNRVNYTDVNNVFGVGAFPQSPLPTYGQFQRAAPPRQAQLAVRFIL